MECGTALTLTCQSCGTTNEPGSKFCGKCGSRVDEGSAFPTTETPSGGPAPSPAVAERKLVSVLFADLVGFTSMSESRDPEDVREFLTHYFDTARRIVARYGGTIEKFIGDAVMAVWGTPVAQEDDAERAVRAALDLAAALPAMERGSNDGTAGAQVRAAVCTGEAAVTLGAEGQGMVAGDLVNTASRVQALAPGGAVLVDDVTRRSTEAAIVYEEAGSHEVKGKAEPVRVWRAGRVVAGRGGALRSTGLESPFVGRDAELRLIKELFHSSAEERKARLASVLGIAGIGKSRLSWEFFKYIDGLAGTVWWHRGRCLAYGEGVSYWALAEMVRMRAGIAEGEELDSALRKLHDTLEEHVPEPEERSWIEPRLANLLGQEGDAARQRDDLFPAWRLFFERLADGGPTVLVFEDLQWADGGLLDFIEYLLEWSRNHPLFVMTLARPELADRHPGWSSNKRNFTSLSLEPLPPAAMAELLAGLVPGLPDQVRSQILARAEGVPLYAVETVRMLIDRGLLVQEGDRYRPTGPIDSLEVPETLHALIAARLDGLAPTERRLIQDAAVLGKTFSTSSLSSLTGIDRRDLEATLGTLVRKEILGLQADPRSPEHGQFGFLQDLVRRVAYETLSRRDRKARHLAAAALLEREWGGDDVEVAEIVASHYLEAYRAQPDAEDAPEIRTKACQALVRAGNRASSLAASGEAQRYFEQALELSGDDLERAGLAERAGVMAQAAAHPDRAVQLLEQARSLFEERGETHSAARVSARLGEVLWLGRGQIEEGLKRMEAAFSVLADDEPDEDLAFLAAQIGRLHWFSGNLEEAGRHIDLALRIAEDLVLPEVLSQALNTKSLVLVSHGRFQEATALLRHALVLAQEHDIPSALHRAMFNLADSLSTSDRHDEALQYDLQNLALTRRIGDRTHEMMCFLHLCFDYFELGRWDDHVALVEEGPALEDEPDNLFAVFIPATLVPLLVARGQVDEAEALRGRAEERSDPADMQDRFHVALGKATVLLGMGKPAGALEAAEAAMAVKGSPLSFASIRPAVTKALEAAFEAGRLDRLEEILADLQAAPPSQRTPHIAAEISRFRAKLATARGQDDGVETGFQEAAAIFRQIHKPFPLAIVLLEQGEWVRGAGRAEDAAPLLAEAREIFERLRATPWLERVARAHPASAAVS